ncbi:MAG: hypothetical protein SA378_10950 [Sedimentibacter sp.]|uniref:hypothetical protein n=1 Tax=Sedimentibacter sp. TaxID=1960295 RepID=UPI0029829937|nr:hypothetical protein [Sedimentibacter sp.]MDW5300635.1 hypothetical protein [Sedimentibacter sp.]
MVYKNKTWYKDFSETLDKGEIGESAFIQLAKGLDNVVVYDCRKFDFCRKRDIDFIIFIYDEDDKIDCKLIEIKTEYSYGKYSKDMQRFWIEDISSQKQNSDGWFRYCSCDIMVNVDAINNVMYMFDFNGLKTYIDLYYGNDSKRVDYKKLEYGSTAYVVNIQLFLKWLEDNGKYYKIVDMKEVI